MESPEGKFILWLIHRSSNKGAWRVLTCSDVYLSTVLCSHLCSGSSRYSIVSQVDDAILFDPESSVRIYRYTEVDGIMCYYDMHFGIFSWLYTRQLQPWAWMLERWIQWNVEDSFNDRAKEGKRLSQFGITVTSALRHTPDGSRCTRHSIWFNNPMFTF